MPQLNPYIRFNNKKCKEAMTFYKECFGGKLTLQTVGETPMAKEDMPDGSHDKIMHASLKKGDFLLMGADMMRDKAVIGDNVSLNLDCTSEKEARTLFEKLSKGGDIFMELQDVFWGGIFGMLTDKYGVEWMFNYQKK